MKKICLSLLIAFSLLLSPMAHAAGLGCVSESGSSFSLKDAHFSNSEKKSDDKAEKSAHHCCCSHAVDSVSYHQPQPLQLVSEAVIPTTDDRVSSHAYGPPLEPPSHA